LRPSKFFYYIISIFLVGMTLRSCVVEVARVNDNALAPYVEYGDLVVVEKLFYGLRIPGAGEYFWLWRSPKEDELVMASEWGDPPIHVVRKITGMPGDQVKIANGQLREVKSDEYILGFKQADGQTALYHGPARLRNIAGRVRYVLLPKENKVNLGWGRLLSSIL
jgi:signal peptidase I